MDGADNRVACAGDLDTGVIANRCFRRELNKKPIIGLKI